MATKKSSQTSTKPAKGSRDEVRKVSTSRANALPSFVRTAGRVAEASKELEKNSKKAPKVSVAAPAARTTVAAPTKASAPMKVSMEFIGTFPIRRNIDDKKLDTKKQSTGPVFIPGEYTIVTRNSPLSKAMTEEFHRVYLSRHGGDKVHWHGVVPADSSQDPGQKLQYTMKTLEMILNGEVNLAVHNMKDIPLELPPGLALAAALKREDARDAMVTRSTYGAIQELPHKARVGANSKRRIMQIRSLRPDIEIVPIRGDIPERLSKLETENLDAVLVAWSGLKRLNISPRYYVALQPEQMLPSACQGIAGVICRADDQNLAAKLHYIEDSEASWASRCERAFLQKIGAFGDVPVGAHAHRKGTQDPWILDTVIGEGRSGEVLRHREIGTSRCKPESLADKAFTGILSKGARKFLPFTNS